MSLTPRSGFFIAYEKYLQKLHSKAGRFLTGCVALGIVWVRSRKALGHKARGNAHVAVKIPDLAGVTCRVGSGRFQHFGFSRLLTCVQLFVMFKTNEQRKY